MNATTLKTKRHYIRACLLGLGFIFAQTTTVLADPVEYTFAFDPLTLLTTISNSPTSLSAFDFFTYVGSHAGEDLYLLPGDNVIIDQYGNITGSYVDPTITICINKRNSGGNITVSVYSGTEVKVHFAVGGTQTIDRDTTYLASDLAGATLSGPHFRVDKDAIFTTLAPSSLISDSPSWIIPDQVNCQLLSGSVDSLDDTANFTTIFDVNPNTDQIIVSVGCVPEPSTLALISIGAVSLMAHARRQKAKA